VTHETPDREALVQFFEGCFREIRDHAVGAELRRTAVVFEGGDVVKECADD
jgi:hypothetical protein